MKYVAQSDIQPKSPISHEVGRGEIQMTEGGYQDGPHFLTGCNEFITCSSIVTYRSNTSHCWLTCDIDYGV